MFLMKEGDRHRAEFFFVRFPNYAEVTYYNFK